MIGQHTNNDIYDVVTLYVLPEYRRQGCALELKDTLVEIATEKGYKIIYKYEYKKTQRFVIKKPHICGGFGELKFPYHIRCSKCGEEIRLWEWGVAYDTG